MQLITGVSALAGPVYLVSNYLSRSIVSTFCQLTQLPLSCNLLPVPQPSSGQLCTHRTELCFSRVSCLGTGSDLVTHKVVPEIN